MDEIKVGDMILVCDELITNVIEIVGSKYYFYDEEGGKWGETVDVIKKIQLPYKFTRQ